ncbi:hypothetical protein TSH7_02765 [Azospirillum sp. TSH7]|uniref:hypothetical protein n=1 Tax=unclassified Azospirillum TaxID=2630922 RepID=UPI000D618A32|nr:MULTISPECIES: hypothetical protein [unclassified Azospirillum]PWC67019.1 hypothetical protein TSH20_13425 [Azospirillum sp. TSH20]PWC68156.1 hypothetical protein TSH7_02765 [Azospirillum sp. TSH7]
MSQSKLATDLIAEALSARERAKKKAELDAAIRDDRDDVLTWKAEKAKAAPLDDPEGAELDQELHDLIRRCGLDLYHGLPAKRIMEGLHSGDMNLIRTNLIKFVRDHERQVALMDRVAKAVERLAQEVRHDR